MTNDEWLGSLPDEDLNVELKKIMHDFRELAKKKHPILSIFFCDRLAMNEFCDWLLEEHANTRREDNQTAKETIQ